MKFSLPEDYPTTSAPKIDLECIWMSQELVSWDFIPPRQNIARFPVKLSVSKLKIRQVWHAKPGWKWTLISFFFSAFFSKLDGQFVFFNKISARYPVFRAKRTMWEHDRDGSSVFLLPNNYRHNKGKGIWTTGNLPGFFTISAQKSRGSSVFWARF